MPKGMPKRADEMQTLEGGFSGAAGSGGKYTFDRPTGSRSARDYKEKEREAELSGRVDFGRPQSRDYGDRTPRTSDDYKKGGMTASKRADGIARRGKTRGTIVMCGGGMYKK